MDPVALGLPHRPPFRFVDELLVLDPGVSAVGRRTFPADEAFFAGHFPGDPIVPGVVLTEALAQVAGLAMGAAEPGARYLLSGIRMMKFLRAVRPDEEVRLQAEKVGDLGALVQFHVQADVKGTPVATGDVLLARAGA